MTLDIDRVEGIIWDLDNTLYRFTEAFRNQCNVAAAKAAQEQGINLSYEDTLKLAQKSEAEHGYSIHFYVTNHGFSYESLHVPYHANIDESSIEMIDGVVDGIKSLGLKQAILTNASHDWALRVLRHMGLDSFFEGELITASEQVNFEVKSEGHAGFNRALGAMGLEPSHVLMVDDLDRNLIIPHEMGMQTAYICYNDPMPDKPHYIDAQFKNAVEILEQLNT